jgi:exonuclease SbcD
MSFRFIHAADIHLDSPLRGLERYEGAPVESIRQASRRALENMVALAIREAVAFVIIAGDLFDGDWKDYNTGLYFVKQMSRLKDAGIDVYLLKGNHDAANKLSKSLPLPSNVHVFAHKSPDTFVIDNLNVAIHGQSFATGDVRDDLSSNYPAAHSGKFNIGVLHTCASGREGHDSYAPCKIEALISKGYHYWALGHIHKRERLNDNPLIIFPGNIQGRHIRETGPKGCSLITVDDRLQVTEEFCELAVMRWDLLNVDLTEAKTEDEAFGIVSQALSRALTEANGMPLAVRIHLEGKCSLDSILRSQRQRFVESIRSLAMQCGGDYIWVEKVKIHTEPPASEISDHFDGPLAELVNLIQECRSDKDAITMLQDELQDLRTRLPAELPELRLLNSQEWIDASLADVQQILLERLVKTGAAK